MRSRFRRVTPRARSAWETSTRPRPKSRARIRRPRHTGLDAAGRPEQVPDRRRRRCRGTRSRDLLSRARRRFRRALGGGSGRRGARAARPCPLSSRARLSVRTSLRQPGQGRGRVDRASARATRRARSRTPARASPPRSVRTRSVHDRPGAPSGRRCRRRVVPARVADTLHGSARARRRRFTIRRGGRRRRAPSASHCAMRSRRFVW